MRNVTFDIGLGKCGFDQQVAESLKTGWLPHNVILLIK
jgi:hypothetical protein